MDVIVGLISFLISFFGGVIVSDNSHFKIKHYRIENKKIRTPFRFALLSDLHGKQYGEDNAKLLAALMRKNPDFVIVAGDLIIGNKKESIAPAMKFLKKLCEMFPVYFALGNHESKWKYTKEEYEALLFKIKEAGAVLLDNDTLHMSGQDIYLHGLTLEKRYYDKFKKPGLEIEDINGYLGEPAKDGFHLLVAHNPEYFPAYARWGADLTVSGHLHGGIMRLPALKRKKRRQTARGVISPKFRLFPDYSGGKYDFCEKNGQAKHLIVSCGLGSHTIPVRVFNPGELVFADVMPEEKATV